ncbi:MAG: hypothetical protein H0V43_14005 [Gemmatimonadales bacterium]|nr:hypothetical protein [Gemmatimonadales bacterium]MBA3553790.1 hypothetical protein [Gemmatimonadales bacterium]
MAERWQGQVERFRVDSVVAGQMLEGHRTVRLQGRWGTPGTDTAQRGWFLVSTDQPLGLLAAYLLEPASEDGVATWNLLGGDPTAGRDSPIVRSRRAVKVGVVALP